MGIGSLGLVLGYKQLLCAQQTNGSVLNTGWLTYGEGVAGRLDGQRFSARRRLHGVVFERSNVGVANHGDASIFGCKLRGPDAQPRVEFPRHVHHDHPAKEPLPARPQNHGSERGDQ